MSTRAKFKVDSILRSHWGGGYQTEPKEVRTVKLSPVYGKSDPNHENTRFYAATPGGSIDLTCANLESVEMFEIGKEYYVDFLPAEAAS